MRGLVLPTDYDWYSFLKSQLFLDEVNFWQPSGKTTFHASPPGTPVFFKLKSPHNAIGGFGILARASVLPAWLAWDSFGVANGARSFDEMVLRIEKYRQTSRRDPAGRYAIGCLMVTSPVFFAEADWVKQPDDWKGQTVQGRGEDLEAGEGERILRECVARAGSGGQPLVAETLGADGSVAPKYGAPLLVQPRLGQGTFRIAVTDAYSRACAITNEHSLPALEAAHIRPYSREGTHAVSNGLLLRSDIHRLFDKGYVSVDADLKFIVSERLREDFDNGKSYYPLVGKPLASTRFAEDQPALAALGWHRESVFLG
jgi:putative restriction endonuclease